MSKKSIYWLVAIIVTVLAIVVLHIGDFNNEGWNFLKGFLSGISISLAIRFIMECRKKG